ncbi:MAG: TrmH family RNA methyltransferase [Desulfurococcaceae archaeon]
MVDLRVVLVGVEGPVNLGVIARTCVNFGVKELYLVNPVASLEEAVRYSARGRELLLNAVIVDNLDKALKDVDVSVATSAIGFSDGDTIRQAISIEDFVEKVVVKARKLALVFGRESTGLTREELMKTDFLVTIPANPDYPVLNLSQSVAIFLWEIWKRTGLKPSNIPSRATRGDIEKILSILDTITSQIVSSEDKIKRCNIVLRRIIYRSLPSVYEAKVLLYWARRVERKIMMK